MIPKRLLESERYRIGTLSALQFAPPFSEQFPASQVNRRAFHRTNAPRWAQALPGRVHWPVGAIPESPRWFPASSTPTDITILVLCPDMKWRKLTFRRMEAMNEPIRHHYMPVFYLSRWKGSDGCICRFSRPYGDTVKAGRVAPKGTAFEPRLYETKGLPPEHAQIMEIDFMAKIDNDSANALTLLEEGLSVIGLSDEARNSWSRFLVAQKLRTPRDMSQLKSSVEQVWNRVSQPLRGSYAVRRSPKEPATLEEFWAQLNPAYADELALSVAQTLMVQEGICHLLNEMRWCVLDVPEGCDLLLTSDNPSLDDRRTCRR
jgi:hypothetical protein